MTTSPASPVRRRESTAAVAVRGVRAIRPSDLAAAAELDSADPAMAYALAQGVLRGAARMPSALADDIASLASLTVASHFLSLGDATHAVNRALTMARATVTAAATEGVEDLTDWTSSDERTRVESWQAARPDAIAQTNDMREAFNALLARTGEGTVDAWEDIAGAWLGHSPATCSACLTPGARPGSLTLSTIRAHVRGITAATAPGAYASMRRADVRTLASVTAALAPMVARMGEGPVAWDAERDDLWAAFGLAWAMVQRGDSPDLGTTYSPDLTPGRLTVRVPGVTEHAERAEVSDLAAWRVWSEGIPSHRTYRGTSSKVSEPRGDDLGYGHVNRYGSAWDAHYSAGEPVAPREVSARAAIVAGAATVTDLTWSPSGVARPVPATVGLVNGRDLTEAEAALIARPTTRRERFAPHAGEGDDSATTAPNQRDVSVTTGALKSFKPVVSPRKRSEGAATIATTLTREAPGTPVPHDPTRAERYAARMLGARRALLAAQGADLPPLD